MINEILWTSFIFSIVLIFLIKTSGSSQDISEQYRRTLGIGNPSGYELFLTATLLVNLFVFVVTAIIGIWV